MGKKNAPGWSPEIPKPHRHPEFVPDDEPEQPNQDDPEIIPEEDPFETQPPQEIPPPGEGP